MNDKQKFAITKAAIELNKKVLEAGGTVVAYEHAALNLCTDMTDRIGWVDALRVLGKANITVVSFSAYAGQFKGFESYD